MQLGLTTREVAEIARIKPRSVIETLCRNGHFHGIKPIKGRNSRLYWPVDFADQLAKPKDSQ